VFCELAAHQGLLVTGLDASDSLLEFARRRVPHAAYVSGELERLPFLDAAFELVTGFDSFQYAHPPSQAIAEAFRVLRPGGQLVMATWGAREQCQASSYLHALAELLPVQPDSAPGPFALSEQGAMAALVSKAGFEILAETDVPARWEYPDEPSALRGMLSAGPAVRVIQHAGETQALRAVRAALASYKQPHGGYRLENTFRFVIARKRPLAGSQPG
jgi:SAM-dependent methyltransferase